jgi:hypothetical protein
MGAGRAGSGNKQPDRSAFLKHLPRPAAGRLVRLRNQASHASTSPTGPEQSLTSLRVFRSDVDACCCTPHSGCAQHGMNPTCSSLRSSQAGYAHVGRQ